MSSESNDFAFSEVCTLLQRLENVETHHPPLFQDPKYLATREKIESWFKSHRRQLNELDVNGTSGLLSAFLPEWRTDRVYNIQAQRLCRILCRALSLGRSQTRDLEAYAQPGNGDLALCAERVMKACGTIAKPIVTLKEVDDMLEELAGGCSFSGPEIRRVPSGSSEQRDRLIEAIYKRLEPQEGKWLTRLILKNYAPVRVDENLILKNYHFLLPDLLRFQRDFKAAARLLKDDLHEFHSSPDPRSQSLLRRQAANLFRPVVGTKISRPNFHKARSIDSCIDMLGQQRWVLERKYDGEYCEIHVDLRKSPNPAHCIKIFSKSGKDSTLDRESVHQTIIDSLRLGKAGCKFQKQAIFLGELVVFSDQEDAILPFEKIRKHVSRSGRFIGTDEDSQAHPHEHLAIVYFDLLLLDDEVIMNNPIEERRMWMRETCKKIHGRALSTEWKIVDFSEGKRARAVLLEQFAASNAKRCEGLVLKPCGVPYLSLEAPNSYGHSFIKLKKDYINGMGDEADFAVIGASYNVQQAATSGVPGIKWTTFHLGCLTNADDVRRSNARPIFKHVGHIDQERCIPKGILQTVNQLGAFTAQPYDRNASPEHFDIDHNQPLKMDVVFWKPFVFEVLGSGFDKGSNTSFCMLRHPRVKKLHEDRTWQDCASFQDLQEQGRKSRAAPDNSGSQETRRWIEKLEISCKKKFEREASATPRSSTRRMTTPPSSVTGVSQRRSPAKPAALRIVVTPTPVHEIVRPTATDSPLLRAFHKQRPALNGKRKSGEDVVPDNSTKKQRMEPRISVTPVDAEPLKEIAANTASWSSREVSRTNRHSRTLSNLTHRMVSLVCARKKEATPTQHQASIVACQKSRCPFSNAVIYLTPCIAQALYVTEDLLAAHDVDIATDISHWDRASFSHPPLTEIVSESQSHEGMRKIVLVERKRTAAVKAIVEEIQQMNNGSFKERIEVYDWRVLEDCAKHDRSADLVKKHFIGATLFDDTRKRALFVSEAGWLES